MTTALVPAPPPASAAGADDVTVTGLDPVLATLGQMVGLLAPTGTEGVYSLQGAWFENPVASTSAGVKQNPAQIAALLAQLLGQVAGSGLGVPVRDPALLGTWYPIANPATNLPTGLFIVSYPKDGNQVFGLGVYHAWNVPPSVPTVRVSAWGMIPILRLGEGVMEPVLNLQGYPITVGIAVEGTETEPLVNTHGFSFNGVKFTGGLDIASADAPVQLSVVVLALKLPDEPQPADRSLADLQNISGEQILNTASSLFLAALGELSEEASSRAAYLLPALGISTIVPGTLVRLPALRWDLLFRYAADGRDPAIPFREWFQAVAADNALLKTWLGTIAGFLGQAGAAVGGDGSRLSPFLVPILDLSSSVGVLSFSTATVVTDDGQRRLYPGLAFNAKPLAFGASEVVLRMGAELELAEFTVTGGATPSVAPVLRFDAGMQLGNADASKPLVQSGEYRFGSLRAGMALGTGPTVVPAFQLVDVKTPDSEYATLDLLSPGELATAAGAAIHVALRELLGLGAPGQAVAFASNLAALLGIENPAVVGGTWPAGLRAPFTTERIGETYQNPLGALASWYEAVLASGEQPGGRAAFTWVLQEMAGLFAVAGESFSVDVAGGGTRDDPWRATISLSQTTLPAALTGYRVPSADGGTRLVLGLALGPELTVSGIRILPTLTAQFVALDLPAAGSGAAVRATWAPEIAARLALPDGFTTPTVATAKLEVNSASVSAGWSRTDGWGWSLFAGKPVLWIGTDRIDLGVDLNFSNFEDLRKLVLDSAAAFAPLLTGVIGVALLRSGTRAGLAATGIFGLLPSLGTAPGFPAGLTWPANMPLLALPGLSDPFPAIRGQLAAVLATPDTAAAALSLLAWAIDPAAQTASPVPGAGNMAYPWRLPLPAGFEGLAWYRDTTDKIVGLGLGRDDLFTYGDDLTVRMQPRLNAVEVSLLTGTQAPEGGTPSLEFRVVVANPNGLLATLPDGSASVGRLLMGVTVDLNAGLAGVVPILTLEDVTLPGQPTRPVVTLADFQDPAFTGQLQQAFLALADRGIQAAVAQVADTEGFQTAYSLLTSLGLAVPRPQAGDPYGINPAGFRALLSAPTTYAAQAFTALLTDPQTRAAFFAFVEAALHLQLPVIPRPVLVVLNALGVLGPEARGWPVIPSAVLELARNPWDTLTARYRTLVENREATAALVSQLVADRNGNYSGDFGRFHVEVAGGTSFALSVRPDGALDLGGVLRLTGTLGFNLADLTLTAEVRPYSPALGIAVVPGLALALGDTPPRIGFAARAEFGDGSRPSARAVELWPFHSELFLQQLADVAPAYVLNAIVNAVVESEILQQYPLVQQVFAGLGMAKDEAGVWRMPALLGLLRDPRGWLLSNDVLGVDGKFDLGTFGALLRLLPAVQSSNGVAVAPTATGARVSGLPYGVVVEIGSTAALATISVSAGGFEVAGGNGRLQALGISVTLGADAQPGFAGTATLATAGSAFPNPYFATAGYDRGFILRVGQGTLEAPTGIALQLLPFLGWGSLLEAAARALPPVLLKELVPRVIQALQEQPATKSFADALQTVGTQLNVVALVDSIAAATPFTLENIERKALEWLLARFAPGNAVNTAQAVATVFQGVLPAGSVTAQDGLVLYRPSQSIPLTILLGADATGGTTLLGLWAELELPATQLLKAQIRRTGIGVPLVAPYTPVFSFGVRLTVPVDLDTGPQLELEYVGGRGLVLAVDPMGTPAGKASALRRELFPAFFGDPPDLQAALTSWLFSVIKDVLPRYVSAVVLNRDSVHTWLTTPIMAVEGAPSPGLILTATSLLVTREQGGRTRYYLNTFEALLELTPEAFLGNLLRTLLQTTLTLLTFGPGGKGSISIGPNPNDKTAFGMRLVAPDLAVPRVPNLVLQLGAEDSGWIKKSGGEIGDLKPGISLYVPITGEGSTVDPRFQDLSLNFVNLGIDFKGSGDRPLVDLKRFRLGAIRPRALVTVKLRDWSPEVVFGGEVTLARIGISLAPNQLAAGATGNPIAQNLLGSGTEPTEGTGAAAPDNPPANPTFSASVGYVRNLWVAIKDDAGGDSEDNSVVLPVQRSFGPLYVGSIGLSWAQDPRILGILFTGRVALAGLQANVTGLKVGVPVTTPTDFSRYTLDLQGLDVSFKGGAVAIGGGLLKTTVPYLSYTGTLQVKASRFGLVALGSYALVPVRPPTPEDPDPPTAPSLFVFGALKMPLGGPPAFFVTGVAAGFSFNRSITLPTVGEVQNYPLVRGVVEGSFTEGESPDSALVKLASIVEPQIGQYWVAAGLTFTTFKLLDSAALLFLSFGRDWEVGLIGLSMASLPPQIPREYALAYIELAFKVSFKPVEGVFTAEAQLTPNSYVIARDCKLTGGFAFYLWFRDVPLKEGGFVPAGTFVISLGGYHPAFQAPSYYPVVPRLGFSWRMDVSVGQVAVTGGAYFALVPTAVMAGGYLRILFTAGPLRAWLDAYANFLIEWQPFYFQVEIGVSIGVAFQTKILGVSITLKVELGADLVLQGPPTHGAAHVHWYVISFTIPLGSGEDKTTDNNLTWPQFEACFLPSPTPEGGEAKARKRSRAAAMRVQGAEEERQQVVKLSAEQGLIREDPAWLVQPVPFVLRADTAIPAPVVRAEGAAAAPTGPPVGVRPMGQTAPLDSPLTVTVRHRGGDVVNLDARRVAVSGAYNGAPGALWGRTPLSTRIAPDPDTMLIAGALVGLILTAEEYVIFGDVPAFPILNLQYDRGSVRNLPFSRTPAYPPAERYPQEQQDVAIRVLRESIMAPEVVPVRNAVLAGLRGSRVAAPPDPELSVMASSADMVLQARPVLARIGLYQNNGVPAAAARTVRAPKSEAAGLAAAADAAPAAPELQGLRRRWAVSAGGATGPALLESAARFTEHWADARARPTGGRRTPLRAMQAAGEADAPAAAVMHEGTLALWKVDPRAPLELSAEGDLPVRVTAFDAYGEILSDREGVPSGAARVEAGAGQVAVHAAPAHDGPAGWQLDSVLTKVNHAYALGDGFALRTQNFNRTRRRGRVFDRGTVTAGELVRDNQALDVGGLRPGWVETVFATPRASIAVLVSLAASTPADAEPPVRVTARVSDRPGATGSAPLAPAARFSRGDAEVLVYAAPQADEGSAAPALNVLAQAREAGATVLGVYALDAAPEAVEDALRGGRLAAHAVRLAAPAAMDAAMAASPDAPAPSAPAAAPRTRVTLATVSPS
ncbi:MAG TPA: DUF6603 domain-containing protein [Longimicrobium sp.]